ncbi:hypothetical protein [Pandoraea bronchicola]|uniref:Uncharacterized protein n=1 Tax=Pandoraea bronchicola TaxID=2508287 RepID=A0A5E5BME5_9BURK|nr:hypothetical protein [Pandoraea bronchicola]VVE86528.1 hypothetical protein PBR20603_00448 [Pandoraea bronchicola]
MPYLSHHRLTNATPHYGIPPTANHREPRPRAPFATELRHVCLARATHAAHAVDMRIRLSPASPMAWRTAFAVMLVAANTGTPNALPTDEPQRDQDMHPADPGEGGRIPANPAPPPAEISVMRENEQADVLRVSIEHSPIRTHYAFGDVLRAISAGDQPLRKLSESICVFHELLSGNALDPRTGATLQQIAGLIGMATGLIPQVQQLRIANEVGGTPLTSGEMDETVQRVDPRNFAGSEGGRATQRVVNLPFLPDAANAAHVVRRLPSEPVETYVRPEADGAPVPPQAPLVHERARDTDEAQSYAIAQAPHSPDTVNPSPADFKIESERAFLRGYERILTPDALPTDRHARLMLVNGHHHIRGEAGYYRATRARDGNHWLVDAPQGSDAKAQVPVTYDAASGQWRAHAPLRLCGGGGCAPSRKATPDGIAIKYQQIADAVRHLPEAHVRTAIERAFHDVSRLRLMRTHRGELRPMRNNAMTGHRAALAEAMKLIDPKASLLVQQREAAIATTHYYWSREAEAEAFCQENAEVLFHFLLEHGVPDDRIRMITVQPRDRPPHVVVLYTESQVILDLLELATPQPPVIGYTDGVDDMSFSAWLFMTRDTTVLLDAWSSTQATSFAHATSEQRLADTLDAALADTGHRPGSPYVVSITRPLRGQRSRTAGQGSMASRGSAGSSDASGSSGRASAASGASASPRSHLPHGGPPAMR